MSVETPLLKKEKKHWFFRLLKFVFILSALVLVGITILANMGGNHAGLKSSVEQFISRIFQGRPVVADQLHHMSFFPKMGFDVAGVNVYADAEQKYVAASMDRAQVFMRFWSVLFGQYHIDRFYIENFDAVKGAIGSQRFYIEKAFIDHDVEADTAHLRGTGTLGVHPWSFDIDMAVHGSGGRYAYGFDPDFSFGFVLADLELRGDFLSHKDGYYKIDNLTFLDGAAQKILVQGDFVLSALGEKLLKVKGVSEIIEQGTVFQPDFIIDYARKPVKVSGRLQASEQNAQSGEEALALLVKIRTLLGHDGALSDEQAAFGAMDFMDVQDVEVLYDGQEKGVE